MQDKILLGFLMQGPQTGYDIKKMMDQSTNHFFNTSDGSIYPAFQKLVKQKLVVKEEKLEKGRAKNIYTITPEGRTVFRNWLCEDLPAGKFKQEALLRTFFFSHLSRDEQIDKIERYIEAIRYKQKELMDLETALQCIEMDCFQAATLKFGIDFYGFTIQWHQQFLKELDPAPDET